jgi:hypothetical protein
LCEPVSKTFNFYYPAMMVNVVQLSKDFLLRFVMNKRLLKKSVFTPKPPKGGFIICWILISPPWGI